MAAAAAATAFYLCQLCAGVNPSAELNSATPPTSTESSNHRRVEMESADGMMRNMTTCGHLLLVGFTRMEAAPPPPPPGGGNRCNTTVNSTFLLSSSVQRLQHLFPSAFTVRSLSCSIFQRPRFLLLLLLLLLLFFFFFFFFFLLSFFFGHRTRPPRKWMDIRTETGP